jgi:hypothetical protein
MSATAREDNALGTDRPRIIVYNPEFAAFVEEQAAWFRSDDFEEALWRRVRRRLAQNGPDD